MARYVEPDELKREILLSKEQGKLTDNALKLLLRMIDRIQRPFTYIWEADKEDCRSACIEHLLNNWQKYQEGKGDIFSYYTQMIKMALYAAWNSINKKRAHFSTSNIFQDEI